MNRFAYVLGVMLSGARVSRRSNPMNIGSKLPINNAIRATKAQKPSVYAPEQGIICPLPRFSTGGGGLPSEITETITPKKFFENLNSDESTL